MEPPDSPNREGEHDHPPLSDGAKVGVYALGGLVGGLLLARGLQLVGSLLRLGVKVAAPILVTEILRKPAGSRRAVTEDGQRVREREPSEDIGEIDFSHLDEPEASVAATSARAAAPAAPAVVAVPAPPQESEDAGEEEPATSSADWTRSDEAAEVDDLAPVDDGDSVWDWAEDEHREADGDADANNLEETDEEELSEPEVAGTTGEEIEPEPESESANAVETIADVVDEGDDEENGFADVANDDEGITADSDLSLELEADEAVQADEDADEDTAETVAADDAADGESGEDDDLAVEAITAEDDEGDGDDDDEEESVATADVDGVDDDDDVDDDVDDDDAAVEVEEESADAVDDGADDDGEYVETRPAPPLFGGLTEAFNKAFALSPVASALADIVPAEEDADDGPPEFGIFDPEGDAAVADEGAIRADAQPAPSPFGGLLSELEGDEPAATDDRAAEVVEAFSAPAPPAADFKESSLEEELELAADQDEAFLAKLGKGALPLPREFEAPEGESATESGDGGQSEAIAEDPFQPRPLDSESSPSVLQSARSLLEAETIANDSVEAETAPASPVVDPIEIFRSGTRAPSGSARSSAFAKTPLSLAGSTVPSPAVADEGDGADALSEPVGKGAATLGNADELDERDDIEGLEDLEASEFGRTLIPEPRAIESSVFSQAFSANAADIGPFKNPFAADAGPPPEGAPIEPPKLTGFRPAPVMTSPETQDEPVEEPGGSVSLIKKTIVGLGVFALAGSLAFWGWQSVLQGVDEGAGSGSSVAAADADADRAADAEQSATSKGEDELSELTAVPGFDGVTLAAGNPKRIAALANGIEVARLIGGTPPAEPKIDSLPPAEDRLESGSDADANSGVSAGAGATLAVDDMVEAFLNAANWRERIQYIHRSEVDDVEFEAFYVSHGDVPFPYSSIEQTAAGKVPGSDFDTFLYTVKTEDRPDGFVVSVEETPGGYRIDWRGFSQFAYRLLEQFANDPQAAPASFYTAAKRSHYFGVDLPGAEEKVCVRIIPPSNAKLEIYAFAAEGSLAADDIKANFRWGITFRPVLALEWVGFGSNRHIGVKRVERMTWRKRD